VAAHAGRHARVGADALTAGGGQRNVVLVRQTATVVIHAVASVIQHVKRITVHAGIGHMGRNDGTAAAAFVGHAGSRHAGRQPLGGANALAAGGNLRGVVFILLPVAVVVQTVAVVIVARRLARYCVALQIRTIGLADHDTRRLANRVRHHHAARALVLPVLVGRTVAVVVQLIAGLRTGRHAFHAVFVVKFAILAYRHTAQAHARAAGILPHLVVVGMLTSARESITPQVRIANVLGTVVVVLALVVAAAGLEIADILLSVQVAGALKKQALTVILLAHRPVETSVAPHQGLAHEVILARNGVTLAVLERLHQPSVVRLGYRRLAAVAVAGHEERTEHQGTENPHHLMHDSLLVKG